MEEVLTDLAKETGLTIRVLLGKGRGRVESRLRAEAVYVEREVGGINLTEAAKYLQRDLSTLSLALKRLEEELSRDSGRQMQMERLCTPLRQGRRRNYNKQSRTRIRRIITWLVLPSPPPYEKLLKNRIQFSYHGRVYLEKFQNGFFQFLSG
jgi:hypothetical protein